MSCAGLRPTTCGTASMSFERVSEDPLPDPVFFHGNIAAVVSHGITKEQRVAPREIERAIERRTGLRRTRRATRFDRRFLMAAKRSFLKALSML
jgi:hypothetical protein